MNREQSPPPMNVIITALPAVVSLFALIGTEPGFVVGLSGFVLTVVGTVRGSRRLLGGGVVGLFSAVVLAGVSGTQPSILTIAAVATLVTWDVGDHVIGLASHLGRGADQRRLVVTHAAWSVTVAAGALVTVVLSFSAVPRNYPILVVVLLLAGLLALVAAVRLGR